ncbi:MAG: DUF11 domain-containing protein [Desulfatibacillum sp.]|nr:DUF11 domain-containing protein [Desulfatibacillum sp.]
MKRLAIVALALFAVAFMTTGAWAEGTKAGTTVSNTAYATYNIGAGATDYTAQSGAETFTVDELVNVELVHIQTNNVQVSLDEQDAVTVFEITNTGNGDENYHLVANSGYTTLLDGVSDDDFNPLNPIIYIDVNDDGAYDGGDSLFNSTNYPAGLSLIPDQTISLLVLNDIPDSGINVGEFGLTRLSCYSQTFGQGAAAGNTSASASNGANASVAGSTAGLGVDEWFYELVSVSISIDKSHFLDDGIATGDYYIPGATITYTLEVSASGAGDATNLLITDGIPVGTVFVSGSLKLDGVSVVDGSAVGGGTDFTDAADSDGATYISTTTTDANGDTCNGQVTFTFADLTAQALDTFSAADGAHVLSFQVTIIETGVTP